MKDINIATKFSDQHHSFFLNDIHNLKHLFGIMYKNKKNSLKFYLHCPKACQQLSEIYQDQKGTQLLKLVIEDENRTQWQKAYSPDLRSLDLQWQGMKYLQYVLKSVFRYKMKLKCETM